MKSVCWLALAVSMAARAAETPPQGIDAATLDAWSKSYRGWHYDPTHVISAEPKMPGHEAFRNTDVPCVYQLPGQPDTWHMSFIAFDGHGYNSFVAESTNLVQWTQLRLAFSSDLLDWKRHSDNPVVSVHPGGFDEKFASDPKVFRDGDHWVMFCFGVGRGGAHIMVAFSRDLEHWTAEPEPLYKEGGHPGGLDRQYAHKTSLVYNPKNDTSYLYCCACGNKGRGIGLITSRPVPRWIRKEETATGGHE